LKRAGMDYLQLTKLTRHDDWQAFETWRTQEQRRLLLLTTRASEPYTDFQFEPDDLILLGRESSGAPDHVHEAVDHSMVIPMNDNTRSINLALSGALVMGEALRQTDKFPR